VTRAEILDAAKACVTGKREQDYGSPEDNFKLIAEFWGVYTGQQFTATDVANMMILLKLARAKTGKCIDNYVDAAGYAACAGEIMK
jgi:hypothetical protein